MGIYDAVEVKTHQTANGRRTYIRHVTNKSVGVRVLAALAGRRHIATTPRYNDVIAEQRIETADTLWCKSEIMLQCS